MFAAADTLITLLIFAAIAIISSWWKKRQGDSESDPWGDGRGPAPPLPSRRNKPPPAQPTNWEEELRRLLEGEDAAPRPAPPPPPPVAPPRPAPKPPPVPRRPAVVVREEGEMEKGLAVELPKLAESARSFLRAKSLEHQVEEHLRQRAGLATSASAFARASQLEVKVAEHLRHVTEDAARPPVPHRERAAAPESAVVRAMLHDRRAARSAILAAVILGPPRSLET